MREEALAGRTMLQRLRLPKTVDEWIERFTDDFGYAPMTRGRPTSASPGSLEKIEALRSRVENGQPLFMAEDHIDSETLGLYPTLRERKHSDVPLKTIWKGNEIAGAEFSECERYRYRLWRHWARGLPVACFIGLNPSTADERKLDNTLRRIKGFAQSWGCGGFEMLNLFGYRATDPEDMLRQEDPVGAGNDRAIRLTVQHCSYVVACWGENGAFRGRSSQVLWAIRKTISKHSVYCLGLTRPVPGGLDPKTKYPQPRHPLYIKKAVEAFPIPWSQIEWRQGVESSSD